MGLFELGKHALETRLKKHASPLAKDSGGFFLSSDGTTLVVLSRALLPSSRLDFNRALMAAVQRAENRAILAFRKTSPNLSTALKGVSYGSFAEGEAPAHLSVGFTGMPAVYVENERSLKWDVALNTGSSLLGVLLLFLIVYRSVSLTWKVTWSTIYTIWLTLAFAGATRGSISILGGAFTAVPVGLGTDYAILIYNTYQHARAQEGLTPELAMRRALSECGSSIITAAMITAIAFFGVGFTHLKGLSEFGILGGVSALIGCVVMLLILPASLAQANLNPCAATKNAGLSFGMPQLGRWLEMKWARRATLTFSAALIMACSLLILYGPNPGPERVAGVRFDPELGNLRALSNRAIPLRERVSHRFNIGLGDISTLVSAPNEEAAFQLQSEMLRRVQPWIDKGELTPNGSVLDYFPSLNAQRESIAAFKNFDMLDAIKNFQYAAEKRFGLKGAAYFKPFLRRMRDFNSALADPQAMSLSQAMNGPLTHILAPYVSIATDGAVTMRSSWLPTHADASSQWYSDLATSLETPKTPPSTNGSIRITAAKMVGFELKNSTLNDCGAVTLAVSLCVAIALILALRSFKSCLLALIPLLFANLTLLAGVPISQLLHWDYSLNFVNLVMFPLLLGSAVDYGVYIIFAYDQKRPPMGELMAQSGRSVLYCIATTLIGFGSFVTSSYSGLVSMGVASLWGYAGAAFGALIVLPAVLGCLNKNSVATKEQLR